MITALKQNIAALSASVKNRNNSLYAELTYISMASILTEDFFFFYIFMHFE